ncbi:Hypothetical protein R9X50_00155000 [Acrodontium crateriforme]|uniref:BZIP domain-containing protein n=1 Tax=Acrodontium crateriforme TaxID=150365 RepID=A0AAQ3M5D9_9PEZI|nr:Hypothetical protein R9X50_00155000 [Acrodontium crateriforme]
MFPHDANLYRLGFTARKNTFELKFGREHTSTSYTTIEPNTAMQSDPYGNNAGPSSEPRSPSDNLALLSKLGPEKKQTKDGQPAKRRGPKPDSKPALTRRQELNRQAQRTHRERKEMYIKALEQEVLRLKESFANTSNERDAIAAENRRLKELLQAHGISYDFGASPVEFRKAVSSSGSISGSYAQPSESTMYSPSHSATGRLPNTHQQSIAPDSQHQVQQRNMAQLPNNTVDYDRIGCDFVLTLERPCMDHMQYLLVRSLNVDGQPFHHPAENPDDAEHEHMSGHALMATAPPHSHIMEKPAEKYPFQMPQDVGSESLSVLLNINYRLPFKDFDLDITTEITPIMAWKYIFQHERVGELNEQDFEHIKNELSGKVRCYGFGAVMEQFELEDALKSVLESKQQSIMPVMGSAISAQQVNQHVVLSGRQQQQNTMQVRAR